MRNEEVSQRVKEERNILQTIKTNKADWIGHTVHRNCLLEHVIEGQIEDRIEVTVRRGRRSRQLLDDFKERRCTWKMKEKTYRTLWRTRFVRGYVPVVRRSTE